MLLLGDLLRLHVYSEAEKFLKPWWDIVIDYLNLVLVMTAVVCGVVGEALLGVLGIRYIYPKYFGYKVLLNTDFWV